MQKLRVFLALLFGALIVVGLITWYRDNPDRTVVWDPLEPLWNKIAVLAERIWRKEKPALPTIEIPSSWPNQFLGSWGFVVSAHMHPEFRTWYVPLEDLSRLLRSSKTFGEDTASIVLLQWCDFGSPYCIESYEKWAIFSYMNAFPDELSYQLKGYPRDSTQQTILQHKAALCAEWLTTEETYLSFYFNIFQWRGELTMDDFKELAKKLKIQDFTACLETKSIVALQQEMKQGRALFGFGSLPANVFVHKETGQYVLVPGLYETQDVLQAIQWLLDQE